MHELCAFSTKERKKQSYHSLKSLTEHIYMHRIRVQHTHQGVAPETIESIPCESFFNNFMYPERVSQKNILKIPRNDKSNESGPFDFSFRGT